MHVNSANAQSVELHVNTRSAKEDDKPFDWYTSVKFETGTDSTILYNLKVSTERDNGTMYKAIVGEVVSKYARTQIILDEELPVYNGNFSVFIPVWLFKIGLDASVNMETWQAVAGLYESFKWSNDMTEVSVSIAHNHEQINRLEYAIGRRLYVGDKTVLGVKAGGLYIDKEYKWNLGGTILFRL